MFHDYMAQFDAAHARKGLRDLFRVLNQKPEDRDPYLSDDDPLLTALPRGSKSHPFGKPYTIDFKSTLILHTGHLFGIVKLLIRPMYMLSSLAFHLEIRLANSAFLMRTQLLNAVTSISI